MDKWKCFTMRSAQFLTGNHASLERIIVGNRRAFFAFFFAAAVLMLAGTVVGYAVTIVIVVMGMFAAAAEEQACRNQGSRNEFKNSVHLHPPNVPNDANFDQPF